MYVVVADKWTEEKGTARKGERFLFLINRFWGPVHINPNKFEKRVFVPKPDISAYTIVLVLTVGQTGEKICFKIYSD